jgi:hypothetical protein
LGDALVAAGALPNNAALWTHVPHNMMARPYRKHYLMKELAFY